MVQLPFCLPARFPQQRGDRAVRERPPGSHQGLLPHGREGAPRRQPLPKVPERSLWWSAANRMTTRRPFIPPRRPVFIGCEGESEVGYVGLLQDLLHAQGIAVHLVVENLGIGASEPQPRVELAVRKLEQLRRTRTAPKDRFVLLDHDQAEVNPQRTEAAQRL